MIVSDDVYVMSPVLPEDSVLLTLPFGGAVLQSLGVSKPATDAILEDFRKILMEEDKNFSNDTFDFLNSFKKRVSPGINMGSPGSDSNRDETQEESQLRIDNARAEDDIESVNVKEFTEAEIPDYLDGSDVRSAPGIDYLDAGN